MPLLFLVNSMSYPVSIINLITRQAVRGPITKINQSKCSIAGPIFSKYWTGHCPKWSRTWFFAVFAFFSRVINLLLTKLARDRTGRISALGLFCTDLAALDPYCQDLGPIFSQYGPRAWLIRYMNRAGCFRFLLVSEEDIPTTNGWRYRAKVLLGIICPFLFLFCSSLTSLHDYCHETKVYYIATVDTDFKSSWKYFTKEKNCHFSAINLIVVILHMLCIFTEER